MRIRTAERDHDTNDTVRRRLRRMLTAMLALLLLTGAAGVTALVASTQDISALARVYGPANDANNAALQYMLDAETAVRGYALTDSATFLQPFQRSHTSIVPSLDRVQRIFDHAGVRRFDAAVSTERSAAQRWLAGYAQPVIADPAAAGVLTTEQRGEQLFDEFRAANGIVATYFRISALIATLAMSFVVAGLASLVTGGNLIILYSHPSFGDLARTSFLSVNTSTWIMVIAVVLLTIVLARTTAGRYMYAAGGNAEAARLAGVRVQLIKVVTFVLSGGAAALGGLIDTSRVLSAQASNGETALTFAVLAGIVVGGTSILGGEGGIWRTVVGVLFIALIGNGFDLLGLNPLYEQITLGAILLIAVGIDAWSRLRTA